MASAWLPLAASIEGVFWVVVVILTIIVQIAKASKRPLVSDQRPDGTPPPGGASPQDELQQFLRALSGERPAPPPAPGTQAQPRPAARPRAVVMRGTPPPTPSRPAPRRETVLQAARPSTARRAMRPTPAASSSPPVVTGADVYAHEQAHGWAAENRCGILEALKAPDDRRKAIVLREILGPCVALRRAE